MIHFDWCESAYNYWPEGWYHGGSLILLLLGAACCFSFLCILTYLYRQNQKARRSGFSEGKTSTLIFPLYTKILWLGVFATFIDACSNIFVPTDLNGTNTALNSFLYGGVWAIYHFVFEGLAFLMLFPGVGSEAAKKCAALAFLWASFTWVVQGWITYRDGSDFAIALSVAWAGLLVIFYGALWLLPLSTLFRRPCVFAYARFWCLMRTFICVSNVLKHYHVTFGYCLYLLGTAGFQSPAVAYVVYTCLLRDCQYWLGILRWEESGWTQNDAASSTSPAVVNQSGSAGLETLRRPLLGTSLAPHSARVLAAKMDESKLKPPALESFPSTGSKIKRKGVKILNFAFLRIDQPVLPSAVDGSQPVTTAAKQVILGSGSSCRVFQGTFRDRPVAIKMIFVPELTPEVVVNFYHEATLLAQLQHENVVEVLGVCVLPPAICLVLELCDGGNLFDYLRAPAQQRQPMTLWRQLSLSWDCCAAVHFLHTHTPAVLHLDLKSLNFLLTREGRVKVADLELSREIIISADGGGSSVVQGSELTGFKVPETLYWLAPEIIRGLPYNEKADVYALALVVWEIFTASVPYRSLEDSLIVAAKNAKYMEALGFQPGQYPMPPEALPYSYRHGLDATFGGQMPIIGRIGSDSSGVMSYDDQRSSGLNSRRESNSTVSRPRGDSAASNASSGGSSQISDHLASQSERDRLTGTPSLTNPTPRASRRSHSSSSKRYEAGEEEEMSTPSSAGSSKAHSQAPSPSLPISNAAAIARGYPFLGGPSTQISQAGMSPPTLSNLLPAAATSALPSPSPTVTTPSLLTHENLALLHGAPSAPTGAASSTTITTITMNRGPGGTVIYNFPERETDPILIEWKRMHHAIHSNPIVPPPHTSSASLVPSDFPEQQKRVYSLRPTLPPIPASVGNASFLNDSTASTRPDVAAAAAVPTNATVLHLEQDALLSPAQPLSDGTASDSTTAPSAPPLAVRSAPFQSDLSPILASIRTPVTAANSDPHHPSAPASSDDAVTTMPPPALPQLHLPGALPARLFSAPPNASHLIPSSGPRVESYVQYDVDTSLGEASFAAPVGDHQLWQGGGGGGLGSDETIGSSTNESFDASAYYPSTVPTRGVLSNAIMGSSSVAVGPGLLAGVVGGRTATGTASRIGSGLPSPALSATGSETTRVPRVTRLDLSGKARSSKKKKSSSSSSKAKKAASAARSYKKAAVDYNSIYVSRHDVQAQLRHLICAEHYRPTIPPDMPDSLALLLTRAWNPQPSARPSTAEFVSTIAELLDALKEQSNRHVNANPFRGERDHSSLLANREESQSRSQAADHL